MAVHRNSSHGIGKDTVAVIELRAGHGVLGDVHAGTTVQHRSRLGIDPAPPNLRQVHLIASELHDELQARGFDVAAGHMGENVTTRGVDLLALPTGTRLALGADAVVELTGLRNPCRQLDGIQAGLMNAVLRRDEERQLVRRAGVMAVVVASGEVRAGDTVGVTVPAPPHLALQPV